ncbi:hypothetical protein V8F06_011984 [Rhypophila decipiens]
MMNFSLSTPLFALLSVAGAASLTPPHGASHVTRAKAKSIPAFPFDPDTAKLCVWWFDNEDVTPAWSCEEIEILHGVSLRDFVYWNPSLSLESCHMQANKSYCLSALDDQHLGPAPEPATVTVISTSILEAPAPPPVTVTVLSTEIQIPEPTASVTITVVSTEAAPTPAPVTVTSVSISIRTVLNTVTLPAATLAPVTVTAISTRVTTLPGQVSSIPVTVPITTTATQLVPTTRTLTAVSVSVSISPSTITSTAVRTTTATATIISTATTTRVNTATATATIISTTTTTAVRTTTVTATIAQKVTIRVTLPPSTCIQTPTKPTGNGISTPSPTQNGLTSNCKTFYFVKDGDTCENIANRFGITADKFISWNQGAKKDCTTLWAGTWACVAVL